jgi:hypothetical protein
MERKSPATAAAYDRPHVEIFADVTTTATTRLNELNAEFMALLRLWGARTEAGTRWMGHWTTFNGEVLALTGVICSQGHDQVEAGDR